VISKDIIRRIHEFYPNLCLVFFDKNRFEKAFAAVFPIGIDFGIYM
jgi:hypothetical protein